MSVDSCLAFLMKIGLSCDLKQEMKAMSDPGEFIAAGRRHGYAFDSGDVPLAAAAFGEGHEVVPATAPREKPPSPRSAFYHYEFRIDDLPSFAEVGTLLDRLKIKPPTVDLAAFERAFRIEDMNWTGMSPASEGFRDYYEAVMSDHWSGDPEHENNRRDFHLINLDKHVHHSLYEDYFVAKVQMVAALEVLLGEGVQLSGSLWYPSMSYRLWHTNETQPGWRMYLIDFDSDYRESDGTSFFRYMNPETKDLVTLKDEPRIVRFFKIEQEEDKRFWHCIVNRSLRNRWSFGFTVPDDWIERMPA